MRETQLGKQQDGNNASSVYVPIIINNLSHYTDRPNNMYIRFMYIHESNQNITCNSTKQHCK